ncbi:uncharacterized protein DUF4270 [Lacinutrix venerupis]|uniref:DUF4270 domain-containing protein n=1 Tax=Lacinutrix venerupis TaxID=1486034 RepID=UPI000F143AD0|nr:DUF4270 domain-containing protein [Lacinutrix venerupis]RLJ65447.1 uncharacterized protein DUF4270 [Lacinutrix venerupis]
MKKTIKSLKSITVLGLILVISISCDKDFTNIESDIQGVKNFDATSKLFPFTAKTQNFTPYAANPASDLIGVKTNNLNGNLFGIYTNPTATFGTTVANVITQVAPTEYNPDFGDENRTVESVWLNIPYFSTLESTDEDGNNTYTLDSIIGDTDQKFKLSIYRSNYVLRDLDPNSDFQNEQYYFSNQGGLFESNLTAADLIYEDDEFFISDEEHRMPELNDDGSVVIVDNVTQIEERFIPGIRVNLLKNNPDDADNSNRTFWENIFFANQGNEVLSTESNFKDFFRGIIIKVTPIDNVNPKGSLTYLNFSDANLLFDYTNQEEMDEEEDDDDIVDREPTVYTLEFNDNIVNTFEQTNIENHDGDEDNLYLKGTDGSMATIELFSGNIENDEGEMVPSLDYFNSKKDEWIINEANLVFYVNKNLLNSSREEKDEPNRLTLYDLKNNLPIIDYFIDATTNTTEPELSRTEFSEVLQRDSDNKGERYKIRLTAHVINMLKRDSTNVKLGLFIANNVNVISESKIQGLNGDDDDSTLDVVPSTSVLSPKATILHGYDNNEDTEFRAKFEIFYTEPEN